MAFLRQTDFTFWVSLGKQFRGLFSFVARFYNQLLPTLQAAIWSFLQDIKEHWHLKLISLFLFGLLHYQPRRCLE